MEIRINEESHTAEIWLTKAEADNKEVLENLMPVFSKYKQQKYVVAVYESGTGDLTHYTSGLLMHNKTLSV